MVAWLLDLVVVGDEAQLLLDQVVCSDLGLEGVLRALGFRGHSVRALRPFWLLSLGHQGFGLIVEFLCLCVLGALQTLRRRSAARGERFRVAFRALEADLHFLYRGVGR